MYNIAKNKKFLVYKHTCKLNGKIYIGITCKKPQERWAKGKGYKNQILFWRAIQKYGWDNFEHEILFKDLKFEDACEKEIELIKKYMSNNPKFGYNIANGGEYNSYNRSVSQETREKISLAKKGTIPWNKGLKHSLESIEKMSLAKQGKRATATTRQKMSEKQKSIGCKPVICVETGEIFMSISDAGRKLNLNFSNIAAVCRGERNQTGNLHFKYYMGDKL